MTLKKPDKTVKPPEISPYLFPILLAAFGLWCFYDGWLTSDPDMLKHALFNKVISGILLSWAIYDFYKVRKHESIQKNEETNKDRHDAGDSLIDS